jgi:CRP-like cAMP-binding protein
MLSPEEQLKQFVLAIMPLDEDVLNAFAEPWQPFECKRKTVLTAAGETERYLYFVLEGVQRSFYIGGHEKQEATLIFTYPYSFSGVADSFLTRLPSFCFFETLTASKFLRLPHTSLELLMEQYPSIKQMVLKTTSLALHGVLKRQVELQCFSAEEKYKTLFTRSPHLLQMIPHKYLASYLGIDASTFSKLLGTVKITS